MCANSLRSVADVEISKVAEEAQESPHSGPTPSSSTAVLAATDLKSQYGATYQYVRDGTRFAGLWSDIPAAVLNTSSPASYFSLPAHNPLSIHSVVFSSLCWDRDYRCWSLERCIRLQHDWFNLTTPSVRAHASKKLQFSLSRPFTAFEVGP